MLVLGRIALSLEDANLTANLTPALEKNRAPMGPEMLSSAWAGVWRKTPKALPDSNSVLDKFQSALNR